MVPLMANSAEALRSLAIRRIVSTATALAVIATGLLSDVSGAAERYTIDSARTVVSFEVRSFGIFRQRGGFATTLGSVSLDPQTGEGGFDVVIDARSVRAGVEAVQRMVRGKCFLNVDQYPNIAYRTQQSIFFNGGPAFIEGDLTLLGITHAVPLRVSAYRCTLTRDRRCMIEASAVFKRSEFGMTGSMRLAGDKIRLFIHAEATADPIE